jgi:hypothetical protein
MNPEEMISRDDRYATVHGDHFVVHPGYLLSKELMYDFSKFHFIFVIILAWNKFLLSFIIYSL